MKTSSLNLAVLTFAGLSSADTYTYTQCRDACHPELAYGSNCLPSSFTGSFSDWNTSTWTCVCGPNDFGFPESTARCFIGHQQCSSELFDRYIDEFHTNCSSALGSISSTTTIASTSTISTTSYGNTTCVGRTKPTASGEASVTHGPGPSSGFSTPHNTGTSPTTQNPTNQPSSQFPGAISAPTSVLFTGAAGHVVAGAGIILAASVAVLAGL